MRVLLPAQVVGAWPQHRGGLFACREVLQHLVLTAVVQRALLVGVAGGIPALAAVFAVLTGLIGALLAKPLFDLLRIRQPEVRGFALGAVSHGIGAARAMQVHPASGAYAALALGLQVLLASLLMPFVSLLLGALPALRP